MLAFPGFVYSCDRLARTIIEQAQDATTLRADAAQLAGLVEETVVVLMAASDALERIDTTQPFKLWASELVDCLMELKDVSKHMAQCTATTKTLWSGKLYKDVKHSRERLGACIRGMVGIPDFQVDSGLQQQLQEFEACMRSAVFQCLSEAKAIVDMSGPAHIDPQGLAQSLAEMFVSFGNNTSNQPSPKVDPEPTERPYPYPLSESHNTHRLERWFHEFAEACPVAVEQLSQSESTRFHALLESIREWMRLHCQEEPKSAGSGSRGHPGHSAPSQTPPSTQDNKAPATSTSQPEAGGSCLSNGSHPTQVAPATSRPPYRTTAILRGHTNETWCVCWSPDGKYVASSSKDCTVRVWDAQEKKEVKVLRGHKQPVSGVEWSPTGELLASVSRDKTVQLWDTQTWERKQVIKGHTDAVRSAAFNPTGTLLATASDDATLRVWAVPTGTKVAMMRTVNGCHNVAWGPNLLAVVGGRAKDRLMLWCTETWNKTDIELNALCIPGVGLLNGVRWCPDGSSVLSVIVLGLGMQQIVLWDASSGEVVKALPQRPMSHIWHTGWSPDSKLLLVAARNEVEIWDVESETLLQVLKGHKSCVNSACWRGDGQVLATASDDQTVRLWEPATGSSRKKGR